jgi:transposase
MTGTNGVVDTGSHGPGGRPTPPDPEVVERARRRQFTAAYKLQILEEADTCRAPGQLGALLRREGLYSSHLVDWRRQRTAGTLSALAPRRRGRPAPPVHEVELTRLRHENDRLTRQLAAAEAIVEIQKKVSALLALTQPIDDSARRR